MARRTISSLLPTFKTWIARSEQEIIGITIQIASKLLRLVLNHAMVCQVILKQLDVIIHAILVWFLHHLSQRL